MALLKRILFIIGFILCLIPISSAVTWQNQSNADNVNYSQYQGQNITTPNSSDVFLTELSVAIINTVSATTTTLSIYTNSSKTSLIKAYTISVPYNIDGTPYEQAIVTYDYLTLIANTSYYIEVVNPFPGQPFSWWRSSATNPYANGTSFNNFTVDTNRDKTFWIRFDDSKPTLLTPANASSQSKNYPPLTSSILFEWTAPNTLASNLVIAKDINFNIITVNTTISNKYSTQALEAGDYWWKVAYYNTTSGTIGTYSNISNFTLTNTITATGTGIAGTVYELVGTTQTAISGATVYLYNNTLSRSMITGSNGYYLFDGLENSTTYNIYVAKQDYDSSPTMPVTTGLGTITTKDIAIKRTQPLFFDADKQYVLLKARWLYCLSSCDIAGATISVYNSGESIPYASGITDSTGSISFLLYKTQLYRITIVKASEGVNKEETLYPKDNSYIFLITNSPISWRNHTIEQKDALAIAVTRNIINSTHTYINVSYNDSLAQTTALNIGITNNNTSIATWSGSGNTSQSFLISNYSGKSYLVKLTGTHTTYGLLSETYSVFFEKSAVGITGIPESLWLWFWIAIMFFTAAVFTASTAELGLIIVCAEGWIGLTLGAFSSINTTQFGIGLTLVSILGVLAYIKKQQAKEGM